MGAVEGAAEIVEPAHIPFDQLDAAEERLQVLAPAGGEIVEDADPLPTLEQCLHEMRTDEAGASGDYVQGHGPSSFGGSVEPLKRADTGRNNTAGERQVKLDPD